MVLSVQAAIQKEHRHEGKYICAKFGYVAQSTTNLPSCQHKTRAFIAKKMYSKLKVLKSCVLDSQRPDFNQNFTNFVKFLCMVQAGSQKNEDVLKL
jgi:hypothetical protein